MLLCGALVSCNSDEPFFGKPDDKDNTESSVKEFSYLSLNIVAAVDGTRADIGYKEGTEEESNVNNIRLYFFDQKGMPAFVEEAPSTWNGQTVNYRSYIDYTPLTQVKQNDSNIDRILTVATTKIEASESSRDKTPYSVIAVVNPTGLQNANMSLQELQTYLANFSATDYTRPKNFIMSNSVYLNSKGEEVNATPITGHLFHNEGDAKAHPVDIYVERTVARLDLSVSMSSVSSSLPGVYDTGIKYEVINEADENITYDGNICVKFLGWNFTSTPNKSRLIKKIDPAWKTSLFGSNDNPWNITSRFRSLWAVNPENVTFDYGNFGQALPPSNGVQLPFTSQGNVANAKEFGEGNAKVQNYLQENAAKVGNSGFCYPYNSTKVIIAAQLVQNDGSTPITLAEWAYDKYTVTGLKTLFANTAGLYKRTKNATGTKFTKISPNDITFVTASSLNPSIKNPESTGRYYVYPQLVKNDNVEWALSSSETAPTVSYEAANEIIKGFDEVEIWNSGYTYYYFDIRHFGALNFAGYYGVVRNHIYDAVISKITSLGTPVYDPNEVIYPEKPDNENSMIIAEIRILTWRLVNKIFKLQW